MPDAQGEQKEKAVVSGLACCWRLHRSTPFSPSRSARASRHAGGRLRTWTAALRRTDGGAGQFRPQALKENAVAASSFSFLTNTRFEQLLANGTRQALGPGWRFALQQRRQRERGREGALVARPRGGWPRTLRVCAHPRCMALRWRNVRATFQKARENSPYSPVLVIEVTLRGCALLCANEIYPPDQGTRSGGRPSRSGDRRIPPVTSPCPH